MATKPRYEVTGNEHVLIISMEDATHVFDMRDVEIHTVSEFSDTQATVNVVFRASRYVSHARGAAA